MAPAPPILITEPHPSQVGLSAAPATRSPACPQARSHWPRSPPASVRCFSSALSRPRSCLRAAAAAAAAPPGAEASPDACAAPIRAEQRYSALEVELRALRAEVASLAARPASALLYGHEKDAEAMLESKDKLKEAAKDRPPTYTT
ncbi:hypothetical protein GGX14DRAFT_404982 [Mycena pura]|uniref:Uncharacterized protein n=1 Tax=Mycena pura TaxID=153505 RepID=A0AAD6Y4Q0_9AGAR|nr:hypothetical protein GGX14DRAFT_404982 [Mycena pura]